jgi:ABC-2 type transport system ATP-binding protein
MAMLTCNELTKYYSAAQALNHVCLSIEPGRIVGLLGPNGSGKTTLLKIAAGILQPSSGSIEIDGHTPGLESKRVVSYLPERTYLPVWMTATQTLDFFSDMYADFDRAAAEQMLAHLQINPKMHIKQMSKGTREKVQLILVMSRKAKLYLLDEPIGGVDPATRDYIIHTILTNYNESGAVVISTHLIADVENVLDDVIFLNRGQITMQSSVDQIREEKGVSIDTLFREEFKYAE